MIDLFMCALPWEEPPCPLIPCCPIPIPLPGQSLDTHSTSPQGTSCRCPGRTGTPAESTFPCGSS